MKKKVLIVHATAGMGHVKAAESLEQAFKNKYPEVEIKRLDILEYTNKFWHWILKDGYNFVSARLPFLWLLFYSHYNKPDRQRDLDLLSKWAINNKYYQDVIDFGPDYFVATHPLPVKLLEAKERKFAEDLMIGTLITDFGYHSYWISDVVNHFFVASDYTLDTLVKNGVDKNKLLITGIPVEQKFLSSLDRSAVLEKLKLDLEKKIVLIVGGQFDFNALQTIINGIKEKNPGQVQFLVVAGRDKALEQALNKSDLGQDSDIKIHGFVSNMEEMMSVADLIFSKAGGLTVSECMVKGLPMVINKVIPGQEEDNVDYLTQKGAAIKADGIDGIIAAVNELLSNAKKLEQMKKSAQSIGHPKAGEDIADFITQKL